MRLPRPLLLALLLLNAPLAAGAAGEDDCTDPAGDVVADDGSRPEKDLGYADVLGVRTIREADAVIVRVRHADVPTQSSHSLSVDLDGDGQPDLSYRDDAFGTFRDKTLYWKWFPAVEENEVVYTLVSDEVARSELDGTSWTVYASSHATIGWTLYGDEIVCESGASLLAVPDGGLVIALAGAAGAGVLVARARRA